MPATQCHYSSDRAEGLRRTFALAALLALALFQVTAASHPFQHQGGEGIEVCGICMQLDRMDDALPPVESIPLAAAPAQSFDTQPRHAVPTRCTVAYRSRAPPLV